MEKSIKKSFNCEICNSGFNTKSNLKNHTISVHKEKKAFRCEICGKCFSQMIKCKEHKASIHEGEKPFQCESDYSCSQKGPMKRHVTSVHEEKKPDKKGSLQQFMKERIPLNSKKILT